MLSSRASGLFLAAGRATCFSRYRSSSLGMTPYIGLRRQRPRHRLRLRLLLALAMLACISFTHDQRDGHGHHGVVMRSGGRRALSILVTDEAATVLQQPLAVEQPG